jgi:hypothetical protein
MKKSIKIGLLTLLLSFSAVFYATSQVTIGTIEQPLEGTLLDLKESTVLNGGANSQKGLMLPRVTLTNLTSLSPILSGGNENNPTLKPNYTGLIVYNVSTTTPFVKGLYSWDGTKWNLLSPISASSGLNLSNDTIKLGGALTQPTYINLNSNDLVVATIAGTTTFDHSNGDLLFRSTQNKVTVGRVSPSSYPEQDTLHIKGRINLDEPAFSTVPRDHYLVLDSTGTMRCRPAAVSRMDILALGGTTNWTSTPAPDILDFYFVDRTHTITLPHLPNSDFEGKLIRFYIYGGIGVNVSFSGVRNPPNWSCTIPGFSYNAVGEFATLTVSDGSSSSSPNSVNPTVRFRFIDIISDGYHWWVNNM